jgi:hypothetical protein
VGADQRPLGLGIHAPMDLVGHQALGIAQLRLVVAHVAQPRRQRVIRRRAQHHEAA